MILYSRTFQGILGIYTAVQEMSKSLKKYCLTGSHYFGNHYCCVVTYLRSSLLDYMENMRSILMESTRAFCRFNKSRKIFLQKDNLQN